VVGPDAALSVWGTRSRHLSIAPLSFVNLHIEWQLLPFATPGTIARIASGCTGKLAHALVAVRLVPSGTDRSPPGATAFDCVRGWLPAGIALPPGANAFGSPDHESRTEVGDFTERTLPPLLFSPRLPLRTQQAMLMSVGGLFGGLESCRLVVRGLVLRWLVLG
jgi:hypothetical protein